MVTYDQIRYDVREKHGRHVQDCWIAYVKDRTACP